MIGLKTFGKGHSDGISCHGGNVDNRHDMEFLFRAAVKTFRPRSLDALNNLFLNIARTGRPAFLQTSPPLLD